MNQPDPRYAGLIHAAHVAGEHALFVYGATLLIAIISVLGAWWLVHRYGLPREKGGAAGVRGFSPRILLVLHLMVCFAIIVGAAALFAAIADEIGDGETLGYVDQAFADGIAEGVPIDVIRLFARVTHLGDPWLLTLWCVFGAALLALRGKRAIAIGFVIAIAGNGVLNTTLKRIFERVRPVHDREIATADGWSFPSGHASGSLVTYGMIAYVLVSVMPSRWRLPSAILATVIAVTTASSRVFLRVHFASDVLAGCASGMAWLTACIVSIELTRRYWRTRQG
jgi:undecaprenyl-diphosphatase